MSPLRQNVRWIRDPRNPILPPGPCGSLDSTRCMNPWAMRVGDEIHLYYGGGDDKGRHRIRGDTHFQPIILMKNRSNRK